MAPKKKGGGKLSRSEVVTIRLDLKLRFAAELVARKQRRTLSSFIEWAIERTVREEVVGPSFSENAGDTAYVAMANIWDVEEPDRFIKFAEQYPELLNFDEERLFKLIKNTPYFERNSKKKSDANTSGALRYSDRFWLKRIRDNWELLNKIIAGEESKEALSELPGHIEIPF